MTLAELWEDLEERLPGDRSGRMVQRIHPESSIDLTISVSAERGRALELEVNSGTIATVDLPPPTRGIAMSARTRHEDGHRAVLALDLADRSEADLFTSVCSDVARITSSAPDEETAVSLWVGRFARWRRFMERGASGLSARRQRGLFAELWAIRELLAPAVGSVEAVEAWKGPEGAPRDFETSGVAIEVKSSAANEPQVVPVHGERQLDYSELDALYVLHLSLEVLRDAGETLPEMVKSVRELTATGPVAGALEDRLLASGYADMHSNTYNRVGYALRRTSVLHVIDGFPRITEADLPDGVGSVRYSLAIDACREFEAPVESLVASLS